MVRRRFVKELQASGINGLVRGTIEVIFNHRLETKEVHNRVLHEEEIKTIYHHVVNGYVGDDNRYNHEFGEERDVWLAIQKIEDMVKQTITALANTPRKLTTEEDLIKHGFIKQ